MPVRTPKERERYVLWAGGVMVDVGREVYLEWHRLRRREKYQQEQSRKYGVCSLDRLEEEGNFHGMDSGDSLEEQVVKKMYVDKLHCTLEKLPVQDAFLIDMLYFREMPVKEVARVLGCSRKAIRNRRKRILEELRKSLI